MECQNCGSDCMDWTHLECTECGANESNGYDPTTSKIGVCKICTQEKLINDDGICNHCFVFGERRV